MGAGAGHKHRGDRAAIVQRADWTRRAFEGLPGGGLRTRWLGQGMAFHRFVSIGLIEAPTVTLYGGLK